MTTPEGSSVSPLLNSQGMESDYVWQMYMNACDQAGMEIFFAAEQAEGQVDSYDHTAPLADPVQVPRLPSFDEWLASIDRASVWEA